MLINNQDNKYETNFKVPYPITKSCTKGIVTLNTGPIMNTVNICHSNPYILQKRFHVEADLPLKTIN